MPDKAPDSTLKASINAENGLTFPLLIVCAFILIIVWGTAFTMVSVAVKYMTPLWLVAYRLLISSALVTAFTIFAGERFPKFSDPRWLYYFLLGQTGMVIPFFLTSKAQMTIDSGLSAILVGIMPLVTIVLAHFFAHEPLSWRKVFGFLLGFIGTIILFLPENLHWGLIYDWKAQLLSVGAALCYAVTTVGARRVPKTSAITASAMMLIGASVTALSAALWEGLPSRLPAMTGLWMVLGLGIGSSGLATILYLFVIEKCGPTVVAKINYFPPFVSVLFGVLFLGEVFTLRIAIAFALIMLGVWMARQKKPIHTPKQPHKSSKNAH